MKNKQTLKIKFYIIGDIPVFRYNWYSFNFNFKWNKNSNVLLFLFFYKFFISIWKNTQWREWLKLNRANICKLMFTIIKLYCFNFNIMWDENIKFIFQIYMVYWDTTFYWERAIIFIRQLEFLSSFSYKLKRKISWWLKL